jgi:hypothetical protein
MPTGAKVCLKGITKESNRESGDADSSGPHAVRPLQLSLLMSTRALMVPGRRESRAAGKDALRLNTVGHNEC